MTQEVELPDGTVLEFPVGTAPDVMRSAIAKRFPQYAKPVPNSMPFRASEEAMRSEPAPKPTPYGFTDRMVDSATMGLSDEAAGIVNAAPEFVRQIANTKIGRAFSPGSPEEQAARYAADYANPNNAAANRVGEAYQSGIAERQSAREAYKSENPVASTLANVAGMVGGIGSGAVSAVKGLPALAKEGAKAGAVIGGIGGFGGSAGQDATERLTQTGVGVLGGSAIGAAAPAIVQNVAKGIGALISPGAGKLSAEQARLTQVAQQEGIPLTTAQLSGSKPVQTLDSTLAQLPLSAGMQKRAQDAQAAAFNKAVLSRAGVKADSAAPDVLRAASDRLGKTFEELSSKTTVAVDDQLLGDLQGIASEYLSALPTNTRPIVEKYISDILNAGDAMPGKVYQTARSALSRQSKAIANADPHLSQALKGLRNVLDDAAARSMPQEIAEQWAKARQEYGALMTVMKAMNSASGEANAGNIPYAAFQQAVKNANPRNFSLGMGELNELARVGKFIQDKTPNSGTPQRMFYGGGALATGVANPAAGLAMLAAPPVAQLALNSAPGRAWLTNQVAAQAGAALRPALGPAAGLAARAAAPSIDETIAGLLLGR